MKQWLAKFFGFLANFFTTFPPDPPVVDEEPPPVEPPPAPEPPPVEPPPSPTPPQSDSQTFVWKPISDNDRMLAIVTPARHDFARVLVLYGPDRKKREAGRYTGRANGNRQHWRFSQPGDKYGKDIRVLAVGYDGKRANAWPISDGGKRWEGR